jgi:alanine racemase
VRTSGSFAEGDAVARPNRVDVDLGAIAHNVAALRNVLPGGTRICAAVKADAYGFGLIPVARTLQEAGADLLGLVDLRDAVALRRDGIACPILLYGGNKVDERVMRQVREHDITLTVGDEHTLAVAERFGQGAPTRVFMEIDVGLERLGSPVGKAAGLVKAAANSAAVSVDGIYTHMHVPKRASAQSQSALLPYLEWQFGRFRNLVESLRREGYATGISMAASTPVLLATASMSMDAVDVGRYLYGIVRPGAEPSLAHLGLRAAFVSLRSQITHCKEVERTQYLDMMPFAVGPGMRVGVVPMGFADGLALLTCGAALVRGRRAPILGGLSLEHVALDVTGIPGAGAGDEVVFIGRQGSDEITQEEVIASQPPGLPPASLATSVRDTVIRAYRPAGSPSPSAAGQRYTPLAEPLAEPTNEALSALRVMAPFIDTPDEGDRGKQPGRNDR